MQLTTLYKRTKTGAIQEWTIFVEGNKFWTVSGQTDGQKVTTEPTYTEPKNVGRTNATTAEEQALAEAHSKWDKNAKTGYKNSIEKIDESSYVEPMLAKNYKDYAAKIDWIEGVLVQTKFNGCRCVITRQGAFSRKGEKWQTVGHITESLKSFFDQYPNAVLDGELFNEDYRQELNQLVSIIRKTKNIKPEDLKKSEQIVRFYCYDGYGFGKATQYSAYSDRIKEIKNLVVCASSYICEVDTLHCKSEQELMEAYNSFTEEGHEGAIVRVPSSPYENKRSKYLLKLKPEDDNEATVVDILEGEGNWAGTGKIFVLNWNGQQFRANLKGSQEQGRNVLQTKDKWIGRVVTFQYNGLTGLGTPNFARVDYNNCIKGDR